MSEHPTGPQPQSGRGDRPSERRPSDAPFGQPEYEPAPFEQFPYPSAPYEPPRDGGAVAPYGDPAFPEPHPYAQPPAYAAPLGAGGRPEHPDATLVLVLGALGLRTGVTAPFAWYFGARARRDMAAQPRRLRPEHDADRRLPHGGSS